MRKIDHKADAFSSEPWQHARDRFKDKSVLTALAHLYRKPVQFLVCISLGAVNWFYPYGNHLVLVRLEAEQAKSLSRLESK